MDSPNNTWIVALGDPTALDVKVVGGKAAALTRMITAGVHVPSGFCLTVFAYQHFLAQSDLPNVIHMELGRKPLDKMRWEEIWDAALRIRSAFMKIHLPHELVRMIGEALSRLHSQHSLAVRSSAPGEDSAQRSFAGLHDSIVNVQGRESVIRAVQAVWASLWSDAALLYRRELHLDPRQSLMAVIVQEMVPAEHSGVAFGRDPRNQILDREIVEAVPGPCSNLVDGLLEPDRWILKRSSGEVVEWKAGIRNGEQHDSALLNDHDLHILHTRLGQVEELFGWPPDMEWAEQGSLFSVLQARPITSGQSTLPADDRGWYLTLRPKLPQLRRLAERVSQSLIPELEHLGHQLATQNLEPLDDSCLADCMEERLATLKSWREIYKKDFIPFAHGVRYLGAYYNDALQPRDPYEFMLLLRGQDFLASRRNAALEHLAQQVQNNLLLKKTLKNSARSESNQSSEHWEALRQQITDVPGGPDFLRDFEHFLSTFMDTAYNGERLLNRPDALLNVICQVGTLAVDRPPQKDHHQETGSMALQQRLVDAVGNGRQEEAREILALGRLSWRLRDDDNILLGRLESQFLRALQLGAKRLRATGHLTGGHPGEKDTPRIAQILRDRHHGAMHIEEEASQGGLSHLDAQEQPRQLIGQPASPGLAEGQACIVHGIKEFRNFQQGNILVCESIQPTMTHLVLLASAVVEQRGGMLIHGAIIARELGIPCVNGIARATRLIGNGDQLMVDGHLGIVTLGATDFELEQRTTVQEPEN